jgi:hypothetical protein
MKGGDDPARLSSLERDNVDYVPWILANDAAGFRNPIICIRARQQKLKTNFFQFVLSGVPFKPRSITYRKINLTPICLSMISLLVTSEISGYTAYDD